MIKINDYYTVLGRDLNYIVECSNENRDLTVDESEKTSGKKNKYFSSIEGVCNFLLKQDNINESALDEFKKLLDSVILIHSDFEKIDIAKHKKVKIGINETWFIVGTYSCYRIIKKEYIKESRFTKEENIGKDKFITYGFAPNIYISLKIILSEIMLEFLSKEDNNTVEDLKEHINRTLEHIKNMDIAEVDESELETDDESQLEAYDEINDCVDSEN